ncbi:MAG TPA: hypothetical protein VHS06_03715 [Chloroflexota bacterium]|nr:hypothetical protein [Chloroflexota bacterium]
MDMEEYRIKRLGFVLNPREYAALCRLSAQAGVSLAAVLRHLVRAEAKRRAVWPADEVQPWSR